MWKYIKGYEGLYKITDKGSIESYHRNIVRIMKPTLSNTGYLVVHLTKDGKCELKQVHRLVAETFIPNPYNLPCVNHKDENKMNNSVDNLEWCDWDYNNNYGTANKRRGDIRIGKLNTKASKPVLQYDLKGNLIKEWPSLSEIKRVLGISTGNVSKVCKGEYKQIKGYIFKYGTRENNGVDKFI